MAFEDLKLEDVEIPKDEPVEEPEIEAEPPVESEVKPADKTVPLAALHEARQETKSLRDEMKKLQEKLGMVDELKEQITAMRSPPPPMPTPDEDPLGYTLQKTKEYDEKFSRMEAEARQNEEQRKRMEVQGQVAKQVAIQEREFVQSNPDYYDALQYVRTWRAKELEYLGVTDPFEIENEVSNNAYQLAVVALQRNKNPAQVLYDLAKQYGFKAKTGEDKLEVIEKGQKIASRGLPKGGTPEKTPSVEALLQMEDPVEFEKAWEKMFGS